MARQALTVNNLRTMLKGDAIGQFIDVRDPSEFASERVAGFANYPLETFPRSIQALDRKSPIVILCTNGSKAKLAANILEEEGFANISIVAGGLLSWKVQCFPLAKAV
jgi:rhodanese-related sulfurtransferase